MSERQRKRKRENERGREMKGKARDNFKKSKIKRSER